MARGRKQRVVLRSKVRQERWKRLRALLLWGSLIGLACGAAILSGKALRYALFLSDFFMVKSVQVEPAEGEIGAKMAQQLAALKGRSIFRVSPARVSANLKARFSTVKSADVSRSFPRSVKVRYELKRPAALFASAAPVRSPGLRALVDEDGGVYYDRLPDAQAEALPAVTAVSTAALPTAVRFLKQWRNPPEHAEITLSTGALRRLRLDGWGELAFDVDEGDPALLNTAVVWGDFDENTFPEKFARLQEVWADLRKKGIRAQYVNLRDVPEKSRSALGDRDLVGRVVVRPLVQDGKNLKTGAMNKNLSYRTGRTALAVEAPR